MSFLLRVGLVVGALSFLAVEKQGETARLDPLASLPDRAAKALPSAWNALPPEARQRVAKEASAEIARRLAATPRSEDTLGETDRRPEWRGAGR